MRSFIGEFDRARSGRLDGGVHHLEAAFQKDKQSVYLWEGGIDGKSRLEK